MRATSFWDAEVLAPTHRSWMADPAIRHHINRAISGDQGVWPLEAFRDALAGRSFRRGLSIGCGTGAFERNAVQMGIVGSMHAVDGSIQSLAVARGEAIAAGLDDRIHYYASDFNRLTPGLARYDLVVFHQSMHHVAHLEKTLAAVSRALTPDGVLYLDEYIGPSRMQWSDATFGFYSDLWASLPDRWKTTPALPLPIQPDDPSEAIRSEDIVPLVEQLFSIETRRDYGGNILSVLYPLLADACTSESVPWLLEKEQSLLASGAASFHAVITARPRRDAGAAARRSIWFPIRPKLLRARYLGRDRVSLRRYRRLLEELANELDSAGRNAQAENARNIIEALSGIAIWSHHADLLKNIGFARDAAEEAERTAADRCRKTAGNLLAECDRLQQRYERQLERALRRWRPQS